MKKILMKILASFLSILLLINFAIAGYFSASAADDNETHVTFTPSFGINSDSCILYNTDEKEVIYKKNADKKEMPEQLVNIMAAIIVLEKCENPDKKLLMVDSSIYDNKFASYASQFGYDDLRYAQIKNEDELTVTELLYAMMLVGSCEACEILANEFGSAGKDFVYLMNEKARQLGCKNTNFTNASGLYDENQYTTAEDMLTITNYALGIDKFVEIATAPSYRPVIRNTKNHTDSSWMWTNSNTMMAEKSEYYYEGAKGIKTGNLDKAGRSLVMECTKGEYTYLLILLNAPFEDSDGNLQFYHLEDAKQLLDWAFDSFKETEILSKSEEVAEIPVKLSNSNDYVLVKPKNEISALWCSDVDVNVIQKNIKLYNNVYAPIKKGQKLGTIELTYNGKNITAEDLVASNDVSRSFIKYMLFAIGRYPRSGFLSISFIISLIISLLYIAICIWAYVHAQNSMKPKEPVHVIPRVEGNSKKKRNKNKTEQNFYKQKDQRPVRHGKPISMTDVRYDDDDFKH